MVKESMPAKEQDADGLGEVRQVPLKDGKVSEEGFSSGLFQLAMEMVTLGTEKDIYDYIGEKLKELAGAQCIIAVNIVDSEKKLLRTHNVIGLEDKAKKIVEKLIKRDLYGLEYSDVDEKVIGNLSSGELIELPGKVYQAFLYAVPKTVCYILEKILGVKRVYAMGLRKEGHLFGNITIFSKTNKNIARIEIETFLNFISIILERRKAERELTEYKDHLEEMVEAKTKELLRSNKDLESFGYSISHDLKVPLRAISGFASMLEEDFSDKLDESGMKLLKVIQDNADHMSHLVESLLTFSKLSQQEIKEIDIDTGKLALEVYEQLQMMSPDRKIKFVIKNMPFIRGDKDMMRQVFTNLLSNAMKFTRPKSETVIEVSGKATQDEVICSVKDNGIGFDMKDRNKLFGVFERLHRDDKFEGTGIGLANIKRIIERHGGQVWAESSPGESATFSFSFPRDKMCVNVN